MSTRVAYFSDLHLEGSSLDLNVGAPDLVIAAGDIYAPHDGLREADALHPGVIWLDDRLRGDVPVLLVPGNHDYEGTRYPEALAAMRRAAEGTAIRVLWNETFDFQGVRYLGTPLWSDPRKDNENVDEIVAHLNQLSDLGRARDAQGRRLTVDWMVDQHEQARGFLACELSRDPAVPKVVITHWAPSPQSQDEAWRSNALSGYWASQSEDLVAQATVWIHGHVHRTVDYRVGLDPRKGRVLSNPRGYSEWFNQPSNQRFAQPRWFDIDTAGDVVASHEEVGVPE
jgi:hypothetical protein